MFIWVSVTWSLILFVFFTLVSIRSQGGLRQTWGFLLLSRTANFCDFNGTFIAPLNSFKCKQTNRTGAWASRSVLFVKKQELVALLMTDWCLESFGQKGTHSSEKQSVGQHDMTYCTSRSLIAAMLTMWRAFVSLCSSFFCYDRAVVLLTAYLKMISVYVMLISFWLHGSIRRLRLLLHPYCFFRKKKVR